MSSATGPSTARCSKDVTTHQHRPGARPGRPCPVPACSGQPLPGERRFSSALGNRVFKCCFSRSPRRERRHCRRIPHVVRVVREEDEMAALDAVGDFAADPTVMLEDVPRDKLERRPSTLRSFATMLWRSSPPVPCLCVQRLSSFTLALNKDRTPNYRLEHPKYTLIILFHPKTISLYHDVCDTLMSRFSALIRLDRACVCVANGKTPRTSPSPFKPTATAG